MPYVWSCVLNVGWVCRSTSRSGEAIKITRCIYHHCPPALTQDGIGACECVVPCLGRLHKAKRAGT